MKKIITSILAVALLCSMSVTAFAASPITAVNGTDSANVKGTYVAGSSAATVYSVDIAWGSMEFTYTDASQGTWNPATHTYTGDTDAVWSCDTDANKITVTNHSNTAIDAVLSYENISSYSLTAAFKDSTDATITYLSLPTAEAYASNDAGARTADAYLNITDGSVASTVADKTVVGTVTVTITEQGKA